MNLHPTIDGLTRNADRIRALVDGVPEAQARWKPAEKSWSILEVVNHLLDEEREDFRRRLDYLAHRPGDDFPPIDPEGWATSRSYQTRDLGTSLEEFLSERRQSLAWLRELGSVDWNRAYHDPKFRGLRAGDLLASWLAHDFLHMRQLVRLHYLWAESLAAPYSTPYAGTW